MTLGFSKLPILIHEFVLQPFITMHFTLFNFRFYGGRSLRRVAKAAGLQPMRYLVHLDSLCPNQTVGDDCVFMFQLIAIDHESQLHGYFLEVQLGLPFLSFEENLKLRQILKFVVGVDWIRD